MYVGTNVPNKSLQSLLEDTKFFFTSRGYVPLDPAPLVHGRYSSFIVSAGINAIFPELLGERPEQNTPLFVAQPVVRAHSFSEHEGYSSSFVNCSLLQLNPSPEQHEMHFAVMLEYLASIGIGKEELFVGQRKDIDDWGTGPHHNSIKDISSRGRAIADVVLKEKFPQKNGRLISVSDVGFSIERIRWVISGEDSYFAGLLSYDLHNEPAETVDALRTMTLLATQTVSLHSRYVGVQFRKLARKVRPGIPDDQLSLHVENCYDFWNAVIPSKLTLRQTLQLVRAGISQSYT